MGNLELGGIMDMRTCPGRLMIMMERWSRQHAQALRKAADTQSPRFRLATTDSRPVLYQRMYQKYSGETFVLGLQKISTPSFDHTLIQTHMEMLLWTVALQPCYL
ncbi:hypothetical protein DVH05_020467 [Phytophthora capsici]|nr:hypothetical protein DVH05_020467 [Phytophthora capsici]